MKRSIPILLLAVTIAFAVVLLLQAQESNPYADSRIPDPKYIYSNEPIEPLPPVGALDEKKVALGEKLFNDVRLSRNNSISCSSCHLVSAGGADGRVRSVGIDGRDGSINAPTVFNAGFNFRQFWDGRAETLEAQVDGPTHEFNEMDSNWQQITGKLQLVPDYRAEFAELYPQGIEMHSIQDAIATFERSLSTPNSRFDRFLRGEVRALSDEEKKGYALFKDHGCSSCHQGLNAGGNMFQKFGAMGDYFANRGNQTKADLGRFNVTGDDADRHVFKVPGLRNVALTAPYFHDGSTVRLEDAVTIMAKYQLGEELSTKDVSLIVSFLQTLSGEYKGKAL